REALDARVTEIFEDSGGTPRTYGSPRIYDQLKEEGWAVAERSVADSMARQGLVARPKRRFRSLTRPDKAAQPLPDLIKRDFSATRPDEKWCGDLTEIPTDEGKLYLASVLDLAARRIPGFAMGEHHDAELAAGALKMAAAVRGGDVAGVIFHSDKGSEGGFERSSQHLDHGGVQRWVSPNSRRRRGRFGERSIRLGGRRDGGGSTCRGSGEGSPLGCPARRPPSRWAGHPPLGVGGSVKLAGCARSV